MSRGLALWLVACVGCAPGGLPDNRRDCRQHVFFTPEQTPAKAAVVGEHNAWQPWTDRLTDDDGDGVYAAHLTLPPGWHRYRVWVDGDTTLDQYNPITLFSPNGREDSAYFVPDCTQGELTVRSFAATAAGDVAATLDYWTGECGAPLDPGSLRATLNNGTAAQTDPFETGVRLALSDLEPGKYTLTVQVSDTAGNSVAPLFLPFWIEAAPFDWRDALIYQIVVDRFARAGAPLDPAAGISFYHGGDLAGVRQALEDGYFDRLGVNVLWLSPLYDNPEGTVKGRDGYEAQAYHGYWPKDPRRVEPNFGGEAALDALVTAAHARGVRVVMDAVLNHVHQDHPYVRREPRAAWLNQPQGDCICGFTCDWGTHMEDCWFDPFLPDLRYQHLPVLEQLTDDALFWLTRFDLDGLRLDAVPMMPRLALRHLRAKIRQRLELAGTPVYLVGETYTHQGGQASLRFYLGPHTLSGQFDYPVMWALRDALTGRTPMTALERELADSLAAWEGSGAVMAPILGNHDVGRLISDLNGDDLNAPRTAPPAAPTTTKPYALMQLAFAFLLTQPGAPVVYYGDEFGMPGATDPDNRRDMRFGPALSADEQTLLAVVQRLGGARRCSEALRRGSLETLVVNDNLWIYGRNVNDGAPALVALNRAQVSRDVTLTLPPAWPLLPNATFGDVLGATRVEVTSASGSSGSVPRQITLHLPPRAAAVLLTQPSCQNLR